MGRLENQPGSIGNQERIGNKWRIVKVSCFHGFDMIGWVGAMLL